MALDKRLAGVLLHPTSLPGRYGIGDIGPECYRFLDWMHDAGLAYWQVLPLGPTSYGDSPYQCFSAFAGNPMLVSPELLVDHGLATTEEIHPPAFPTDNVDYGWVIQWKTEVLRRVHEKFIASPNDEFKTKYDEFQKRKDIKVWLQDYAEFRVCKDLHDGCAWNEWEEGLKFRKKAALTKLRKEHKVSIDFHKFIQFLFFYQWEKVRAAAAERNIQIIGDAPIYVAYDSSDTWANQELFQLDSEANPTSVAGVPPDYFSATGQLWGNPLYNWAKLKATKYKWWMDRMTSIFELVDVVRLDHFRGFMAYWSVPAEETTAVNGKWVKGPGAEFFKAVKRKFKELPIIAEDLGEITEDVIEVRDQFNLPGMNVMQFAWSVASVEPLIPDPGCSFQLHNHLENSVVYTGTHDNDTSLGWFQNSSEESERHHLRVYLATDAGAPHWDLIRAAMMSVGRTAIVPMQDFLGLGSECRMNFPGKASGNWSWRMNESATSMELSKSIRSLTLTYQRCATPPPQALPPAKKAVTGEYPYD